MKIAVMVTIAAMAATLVQAREAGPLQERTVTVCMETPLDDDIVDQAQVIAYRMFAKAGVNIQWRSLRACPPSDGPILVSLSHASNQDAPGVLAYAQPYEGVHVRVLYDRVLRCPVRTPRLLAHVLVHEITHILQGISRHSETGVMKAQWSTNDYVQMSEHTLAFTEYDVSLIQSGLIHRNLVARSSGRAISTRAALIASSSQQTSGNRVELY